MVNNHTGNIFFSLNLHKCVIWISQHNTFGDYFYCMLTERQLFVQCKGLADLIETEKGLVHVDQVETEKGLVDRVETEKGLVDQAETEKRLVDQAETEKG